MNTMMKFCTNDIKNSSNNSNTKDTSNANTTINKQKDESLENLSLKELYKIADCHKQHVLFLKEIGMCDDAKQQHMVARIEYIFEVIARKAGMSNITVSSSNV